MAGKPNIRSIRFSDEMAELRDQGEDRFHRHTGSGAADRLRQKDYLITSYYNKFGQESRAASPAFFPSRA